MKVDDKPDDALAASLIDAALDGVSVVTCHLCGGLGRHPKGLGVRCPRCLGSGKHVQAAT